MGKPGPFYVRSEWVVRSANQIAGFGLGIWCPDGYQEMAQNDQGIPNLVVCPSICNTSVANTTRATVHNCCARQH